MRTLTPVLCTSGLAAEARVARAAGFQVIVGAGDPEGTTALVKDAARDAKCLVSFGVAGGLAPHLAPGHVILSAEVIGDEQRWRPNEQFQRQIAGLAERIGAVEGPVLGSRAILATEDDKMRAWRDTGALAVDLESALVAPAAEAAGRCRSSGISGAISPLVRTPRRLIAAAFSGWCTESTTAVAS